MPEYKKMQRFGAWRLLRYEVRFPISSHFWANFRFGMAKRGEWIAREEQKNGAMISPFFRFCYWFTPKMTEIGKWTARQKKGVISLIKWTRVYQSIPKWRVVVGSIQVLGGNMGKRIVSAQVDDQIVLMLEMIAKIEQRRRSDIIRRAIEKYLLTSKYHQRRRSATQTQERL